MQNVVSFIGLFLQKRPLETLHALEYNSRTHACIRCTAQRFGTTSTINCSPVNLCKGTYGYGVAHGFACENMYVWDPQPNDSARNLPFTAVLRVRIDIYGYRFARIQICMYDIHCRILGQNAYRVAKMHRMPLVAGLFPQKSHQLQGSFAESNLHR